MLDSIDELYEFDKAGKSAKVDTGFPTLQRSGAAIYSSSQYRTQSFKEIKYQSQAGQQKETSLDTQAAKIDFYLAQNSAAAQS